MKRIPDEKCAGICGLFCGTCPSYPEDCHGCLSDEVRPGCEECIPGFRACSREHGVTRCYECGAFPCGRIHEFSKQHIVNGICHHENIIRDLKEMDRIGVENWVKDRTAQHICPQCGELMWWCEKPHVCK